MAVGRGRGGARRARRRLRAGRRFPGGEAAPGRAAAAPGGAAAGQAPRRVNTPGERREARGPSGTASGIASGAGAAGRGLLGVGAGRGCGLRVSAERGLRCDVKEAKAGEKRAEPLLHGPVVSCSARAAVPAWARPQRGLGPGRAAPRGPGRGARQGRHVPAGLARVSSA